MEKPQILWADDEIDLLLPHVIFLREKGYDVLTVNNGDDAIEKVRSRISILFYWTKISPDFRGSKHWRK